jgi:hypothetical protein
MDFPNFNFEELNETDVREEIIAPLLRELGYRSGTENDVIREQSLKYPRSFLGRKKNNDPILRGKADYICEIINKTRWVIEAKAPSEPISDTDAIEQAWSYANHPEIRAIYFCVCNGLAFSIYQTNKGADAPAIFECLYEEMKEKLSLIKNILSPEAIFRDYPTYEPDYGEPLSSNLRSFARLTNGKITYESNSSNLKPLEGMVMTITDGSVERTKAGKIEAYIKTQVPFQQLQNLNEQLGLHEFNLETEDSSISINSDAPTTFIGKNEIVLPRGIKVLDLVTWQEVELQINLSVVTETIAVGSLHDNTFNGSFTAKLFYKEIDMRVQLDGKFTAQIN